VQQSAEGFRRRLEEGLEVTRRAMEETEEKLQGAVGKECEAQDAKIAASLQRLRAEVREEGETAKAGQEALAAELRGAVEVARVGQEAASSDLLGQLEAAKSAQEATLSELKGGLEAELERRLGEQEARAQEVPRSRKIGVLRDASTRMREND
jgi:hypothetical protein